MERARFRRQGPNQMYHVWTEHGGKLRMKNRASKRNAGKNTMFTCPCTAQHPSQVDDSIKQDKVPQRDSHRKQA